MYVKKTNWGYKSDLASKDIKYYNMLGKVAGAHKVDLTDSEGNVISVTAKYILVCVGGRPTFLDGIDRSLVITSDDIFSMKKAPGPKILIVGASYIALECAGFLHGFGYDVTVMVRSIFLRGFD
jgi:thioredoxin reductase (NADPH)